MENFDWYNSNTRIDYPFVRRIDTPANLHELFVDAYILHNKLTAKNNGLRLTYFDPAGLITLKFTDGTTLAVLTPADDFSSTTFGEYRIYRWLRDSKTGLLTDEELEVQVVVWIPKLTDFTFPVSPLGAEFVPSLVQGKVPRVKQLLNAIPLGPVFQSLTGELVLEAGFNVQLEKVDQAAAAGFVPAETTEVRQPTIIRVGAVAGAGAGQYPGCVLEPPVKLINGVGPDAAGNFKLDAKDCYWVERPLSGPKQPPVYPGTDYTASAAASKLKFHNDCQPCCACADYVNLYGQMSTLWDRAKIASRRIHSALNRYKEIYDKMCTTSGQLTISVRPFPRPGFALSTAIEIRNNTGQDIVGLTTLQVEFNFVPNCLTSIYVDDSGILDMPGSRGIHANPVKLPATETYHLILPDLAAGQYARFSFDTTLIKVLASPTLRQNVDVTLAASVISPIGTATSSAVTRLLPPLKKE